MPRAVFKEAEGDRGPRGLIAPTISAVTVAVRAETTPHDQRMKRNGPLRHNESHASRGSGQVGLHALEYLPDMTPGRPGKA